MAITDAVRSFVVPLETLLLFCEAVADESWPSGKLLLAACQRSSMMLLLQMKQMSRELKTRSSRSNASVLEGEMLRSSLMAATPSRRLRVAAYTLCALVIVALTAAMLTSISLSPSSWPLIALAATGLSLLIIVVTTLLVSRFAASRRSKASTEGLPDKFAVAAAASPSPGICPICLDDSDNGDSVIVLSCNHHFHDQCFSLWLETGAAVRPNRAACPVCRVRLAR
ncbi:hypothetical protein FOZ62_021532 [Perkinsus olseni]|uniref:RING-type domain-containing protein n=1 Tax=Perkinsus olseni TaxID=32597 RepID=A0A7J6R593_PEROL|nr:hypothetical protein FOZ62_021532 [Perkinsus olseni]